MTVTVRSYSSYSVALSSGWSLNAASISGSRSSASSSDSLDGKYRKSVLGQCAASAICSTVVAAY
jgi:hypothetical protein